MAKKAINKIIYFDKETIRNILQERDRTIKSNGYIISSSSSNLHHYGSVSKIETRSSSGFTNFFSVYR